MAEDPETWAELKASIAEWLSRDDLTARIPEFIALAERRFNRVLRVPEMETEATLTLGGATESLPTDFLELRAIHIDGDPKAVLEQLTLAELRGRHAAAATGKPRNFAIQGGSALLFGPAPDATYSLRIDYFAKIPALGASQASNWLLLAHPDIYLWGALLNAEAYLVNDARLAVWKLALEEALEELRGQGRRKAYAAAPQRIRPGYCV